MSKISAAACRIVLDHNHDPRAGANMWLAVKEVKRVLSSLVDAGYGNCTVNHLLQDDEMCRMTNAMAQNVISFFRLFQYPTKGGPDDAA